MTHGISQPVPQEMTLQNQPPWIRVNTPDGPMQVYRARPMQSTGKAVIVLQEAFGVNAHMQDIARRFAASGFLTLAPDLFHRTGIRELSYAQHGEAVALTAQIDAQAITTDTAALLEYLHATEGIAAPHVGIVGFCFGGRAAFTAAAKLPAQGPVVVFYGPGIAAGPHAVLHAATAIKAPMLLHVGAHDPTIPPDQVQAISDTLRAANVRFTQHVYADAGHAFVCDARPEMYRADAALTAWQRTQAFLNTHLPDR